MKTTRIGVVLALVAAVVVGCSSLPTEIEIPVGILPGGSIGPGTNVVTGTGNKAWLSVGWGNVDPAAYGGPMPCPGTDVDSQGLYTVGAGSGYTAVMLQDAAAPWSEVIRNSMALTQGYMRGDRFVLTMSGHGAWGPDDNGDEPSGMDSFICAWDQQVRDDRFFTELLVPLARQTPGLRVTIIADQCHSEGNFKHAKARGGYRLVSELHFRGTIDLELIHIAGSFEPDYAYGTFSGGRLSQNLLSVLARGGATTRSLFVDTEFLMPSNQPIVWSEYGNVSDAFRNMLVLE